MSEIYETGDFSSENVTRLNKLTQIEDQLTGLKFDQTEVKSTIISNRGSQISSNLAESVTLVSQLAVINPSASSSKSRDLGSKCTTKCQFSHQVSRSEILTLPVLYEYTHKELDIVKNAFRTGNWDSLRDLPNELKPFAVQQSIS